MIVQSAAVALLGIAGAYNSAVAGDVLLAALCGFVVAVSIGRIVWEGIQP